MVVEDAEARAERLRREDEKLAKLLRSWEDKTLNQLLATPEGRQFIWWLLGIGKWGTQPYAANDVKTNFACGEMNVGLQIFDRLVEVNPQGYLRIVEDQNARSSRTNEPDDTSDASDSGDT